MNKIRSCGTLACFVLYCCPTREGECFTQFDSTTLPSNQQNIFLIFLFLESCKPLLWFLVITATRGQEGKKKERGNGLIRQYLDRGKGLYIPPWKVSVLSLKDVSFSPYSIPTPLFPPQKTILICSIYMYTCLLACFLKMPCFVYIHI